MLSGYTGKGVIFGKGEPGKRGSFDVVTGNGVLRVPTGAHTLDIAYYLDESQALSLTEVPDILLTLSWPQGYHHHLTPCPSPLPSPDSLSLLVASVVDKLSPRYHFAVSAQLFYPRPAYKSAQGWATYFVGLGRVDRDMEWRTYAYDLEIEGMEGVNKRELMMLPGGIPPNPYSPEPVYDQLIVNHISKTTSEKQLYRFFSSYATIKDVQIIKGRHSFARLTVPHNESVSLIQATNGSDLDGRCISVGKINPEDVTTYHPHSNCWFCLSSQKCEERLIVEIYKHWYAAVPKGQMTDSHLLLVPIPHIGRRGDCVSEAQTELKEILKNLREKLGSFLSFEYGKTDEKRAPYHLYINILPLETTQTEWLLSKFQGDLVISPYEFHSTPQYVFPISAYTLLSLHTSESTLHELLTQVPDITGDPARVAICQLISKPELSDWRRCEDSAAEMTSTARLRHILTTSKSD